MRFERVRPSPLPRVVEERRLPVLTDERRLAKFSLRSAIGRVREVVPEHDEQSVVERGVDLGTGRGLV